MILTAIAVFAATNLDDLVVLIALDGSRTVGRRQIVVGQSLGLAALVAVSIIAALGLVVVPERWIGLFGVVPLALGVRGLLRRSPEGATVVTTTLGVAGVVIANGADNVSVYVPLFRQAGWGTLVYVAVFAIMVAVWLAAAAYLASRERVAEVLDRWGYRIVPLVFIAIGVVLIAGAVAG